MRVALILVPLALHSLFIWDTETSPHGADLAASRFPWSVVLLLPIRERFEGVLALITDMSTHGEGH